MKTDIHAYGHNEPVSPGQCPFCGSQNVHTSHYCENSWFYVACNECAANGPEKSSEAEAIFAWNFRAELPVENKSASEG